MKKGVRAGLYSAVVYLCLNVNLVASEGGCVSALSIQALSDIQGYQSAIQKQPLLEHQKIITSKTAMHALYFSKELKAFAAALGVKDPEYGRTSPQIDFMDLNSAFVPYFIDFINAIHSNQNALDEISAWLKKVEISYKAHLDSAWRKENKRIIERMWESGKFEPYKVSEPKKDLIFKEALRKIELPEVLTGRFLAVKVSDKEASTFPVKVKLLSNGSTGQSAKLSNEFHEALAQKLQLVYQIKGETEALRNYSDHDEEWHVFAMAVMKRHADLIEWSLTELKKLQTSNDKDLVATLARFVQKDLSMNEESDFLSGINPGAINLRSEFLEQKSQWQKAIGGLKDFPRPTQST